MTSRRRGGVRATVTPTPQKRRAAAHRLVITYHGRSDIVVHLQIEFREVLISAIFLVVFTLRTVEHETEGFTLLKEEGEGPLIRWSGDGVSVILETTSRMENHCFHQRLHHFEGALIILR